MKRKLLILCALVSIASAQSKQERFKAIHMIFVEGNNVGAEGLRDELEKGKSCFQLATNKSDADAVLEVKTDSAMTTGGLGVRDYVVSGNLTDKQGNLLWSRSMRGEDSPFSNGGKQNGKYLLKMLTREACKK